MNKDRRILLSIIIMSLIVIFSGLFTQIAEASEDQYVYLSDLQYRSDSSVAWGSITLDRNLQPSINNGLITLLIDGEKTSFYKGVAAHAISTLIYDISDYDYDYFTSYIGVDQSTGNNGNGVKFLIYTSVDGENWDLRTSESPQVMKGNTNAQFVKIDIRDANYLKLYAHNNGNESSDHSVYADAKLIKEGYEENTEPIDFIKTVEQYDEEIKRLYGQEITFEYEKALLRREFVNNVGYDLIEFLSNYKSSYKNAIKWLINGDDLIDGTDDDLENIRYYILGGAPSGNYSNSLKELSRLYEEYKDDFNITEPISEEGIRRLHNRRPDAPITKGDLYKRMAITLSLTHSTRVCLWMQPAAPENQSDSVVRYKIYKDMYNQGKFKATDAVNITPWFESYNIEEMRYVMNTALDDESTIWLNEYTQSKINAAPNSAWGLLTPHSYISYVWPNYGNPVYYAEENYDYFNELFSVGDKKLYDYGITRGTSDYKVYKLWMNFRNKFGTGCVCGGISKSGHCIRGSHAIPSAVIGQPGHAALLYYTQDANGKGYWGIDNDVSGWTLSEKGERMPLGWGNASYSRGYSVVYIALAQEAMNDQENLEKCQTIMLQAKVCADDPVKQEEIYREALRVQPINIDAWYGLYNAYCANPAKTEDDFYDLAEEMAEALKYFPLPMYHLTNLIKPKMESVGNSYRFTLLQTRILNEGKSTPNNTADSYTVYQPSLTRLEANYILGNLDTTIATFSFDGEDANKIVLSSRFDGNGVRWDYCIDGNPTGGLEHWNEVSFDGSEEHKLLLTPEEIASITAENDIYIHIVGVNYSDENLYKIDIQESAGLPATLYANDWENKLIAATPVMMWKLNENDPWTLYRDAEPDLSGDKTVTVKVAATGVYLESKTESSFTFTANTDPDTRKYISINHITLDSFSTEAASQGRHAINAIDGNLNTSWHSNWNGNDPDKFIVFKFDEVKNLTALEYFPAPGGNGKILSAQILVSLDGEEWTEIISGTNWTYANTNDVSTKVIDFDPVKALYVKVVGKQTQNSFITARMFNLYENTTVRIVGTFSFDGDKAKKIIIDNDFKGQNWQYSLDGGSTWKNGSGDEHLLTDIEVSQITSENHIKMKFDGNSTQYTIKINKMDQPTITAYLNDWENRLIGVTNKNGLEWRIEGTNNWTDYTSEDPIVEGSKKLYIRAKSSLNFTASDPVEYQFTEDGNTPKVTYIPISHLSVHAYTSQSIDSGRPYYAPNAIDGNPNTLWHTDFRYALPSNKASYTIKLDSNKYISALEYKQNGYRDNDPIYSRNIIIYVSENGEDWIEAGRLQNIEQISELRKIEFPESISGQYVKIEMEGYGIFAALSMVNLYEDTTVKKVGSFSFDGEDANKIILIDEFKGLDWEYSLDNGNTWKRGTSDTHTLTQEEVERVNGDDKIKIKINNVEYVINIQKSSTPIITAYLNDLENRLIGMNNTDTLEWKIESNRRSANGWTDYSKQEPIVEGDAKLLIREKARNVFAASEIVEFEFTADNQTETRKYIPVSHLSIAGVSAEDKAQNGAATNAIDGNYNTRWLNSAAGTDNEKYIIVKFDSAVYLSAMDYVPHSENGKILSGTIEGSMDGENFTEIAQISDWANNQNTKTIDFDESVKVRYVKITGVETSYTSAKRHVGARMFNFYEDITKKEVVIPTAEVEYSTTNKTNKDVVATLVRPSTNITVLNNNGSTEYTFTENGSFTFEFEDSEGNKGTATATVDWICKTLPEAILEYDIPTPTNKDVTVTVKFKVNGEFNDEVIILNEDGSNKHTFTENGSYTFNFRGPYGNEGSVTANVDWIHKTLPEAIFEYDIEETTNKPVTVTVKFKVKGELNDNVTILNNNGSNKYTFTENGDFTFEFRGPYGNEGVATARVNWIDKTIPSATVRYDITNKTNRNVVATLEAESDDIRVTNNNGSNTYTFTQNGEFIFEFVNGVGNKGTAIARVDWIDKKVPTGNISYNITQATNQPVIATIRFDKENVTITNNDGKNTYTFTENKEFTFEFIDDAGNVGTSKAKVDWIDKTLPVAKIRYSTTELTNKDVVATIEFDKENVTVKDGNTHTFTQNGEYEFEFVGPAGNSGVAKAVVTWIDKVAPEPLLVYSTVLPTNNDVTATVVFENEQEGEVTILNNSGKNSYVFEENGNFTFEFSDRAGNKGIVTANVTCIDKIAPRAEVEYDITESTNGKVVATLVNNSEEITITNNDGKNTYTFTENKEFIFEFRDAAGNTGTAKATVTWIDKSLPVATITYSTTNLTNKDVIATIEFNKPNVTVEDGNTHTFTQNGEYVFEFTDEAGNTGMETAVVNWIDKRVPVATIEYSTTNVTDKDVIATITFDEEDVTVLGGETHIFTDNDEYTFEFVDRAGNKGTATAKVTWIQKEVTKATITYDIEELTNEDVIATITFEDENTIITNNDGEADYIFTENDEFIFEFTDSKGNEGTAIAKVTWIDKEAPTASVSYDITEKTTQNVTATLVDESEEIEITNNNGENTYVFTENGEFIFEFVDKAGNEGTAVATVDWIEEQEEPSFDIDLVASKDSLNPGDEFEIDIGINNMKNIENGLLAIMGQLEYDSQDLELLDIIGKNGWNIDKDSFNEKNLKFVTENGKFITENGSIVTLKMKVNENINESKDITFIVKSVIASNTQLDITTEEKATTLHVEVAKEDAKITSETYTIKDNIISRILPKTTVSEFKNNVTANREITVIDENGNILKDEDVIATGMTLEVGDKELTFTLVVIGDINRDGIMSLTDLALIKLHLVEKEVLTGVNYIAADIDNSGNVSLTDLAQIKLILVELEEIKQ